MAAVGFPLLGESGDNGKAVSGIPLHRGYVKLFRKIEDCAFYQDDALKSLWIHCLIRAAHAPRDVVLRTIQDPIRIEPGQFITGRDALHWELYGKREHPSPRSLWRSLQKLETIGNLSIKSGNKYSIITIVNWASYQSGDPAIVQQTVQQMASTCPTDGQHVSTNKHLSIGSIEETNKHGAGKPKPTREEIFKAIELAVGRGITHSEVGQIVPWVQLVERETYRIGEADVDGLTLALRCAQETAQRANPQTVYAAVQYARKVFAECQRQGCWPGERPAPTPSATRSDATPDLQAIIADARRKTAEAHRIGAVHATE